MLRVVKPGHIVRRDIVAEVGPAGNRPIPEAGEDAGQDVHHARQPVALVGTQLAGAAQRQQRVVVRRIGFLHYRVALGVRQPARLQPDAQPPRDAHLVAGHRAGGRVKHKGRLLPRRRRNGNRIRPQTRLRPESRHYRRRAAGHTDANHIVFQGHHRMVGCHPQMPRVANGDHAHAHLARLADGDFHRLGRGDDAQPPVGVDAGGAGRFPNNAQLGLRVDLPGRVAADIAAQHIGNAVGIHAPQVGQDQHIGAQPGILRRHAHFLKHGGHGGLQRVPRNHRRLVQTHAKLG